MTKIKNHAKKLLAFGAFMVVLTTPSIAQAADWRCCPPGYSNYYNTALACDKTGRAMVANESWADEWKCEQSDYPDIDGIYTWWLYYR